MWKTSEALLDSLRGSSVKLGTMQRILAWPLRKDDRHESRSVNKMSKPLNAGKHSLGSGLEVARQRV